MVQLPQYSELEVVSTQLVPHWVKPVPNRLARAGTTYLVSGTHVAAGTAVVPVGLSIDASATAALQSRLALAAAASTGLARAALGTASPAVGVIAGEIYAYSGASRLTRRAGQRGAPTIAYAATAVGSAPGATHGTIRTCAWMAAINDTQSS